MPLYMDIHSVPGVRSKDVAQAHRNDLLVQQEYGCNCMTYWIDEQRETIFCLIEAADRDAVKEMHRKAHGLVPHKIIEVSSSVVQSFLGRIYDPGDAILDDGVKVFTDPGFRVLLVTRTNDHALLQHCLGAEQSRELIGRHNEIIRKNILIHNGSEVEHDGEGFIVSFESATQAVKCAVNIKNQIPSKDSSDLNFRLAVNSGEPIEKSNNLFGDTIQFGHYLCSISKKSQVALSAPVRDLSSKDLLLQHKGHLFSLSQPDEDIVRQLFNTLEAHFHDSDFDLDKFSGAMAMSQTQLYRKATSLTGLSTNNLLKEFRLEKARELLKKGRHSVSQVTFETGFSSPSYFTKCFKTRFGLLPMEYIELLRAF